MAPSGDASLPGLVHDLVQLVEARFDSFGRLPGTPASEVSEPISPTRTGDGSLETHEHAMQRLATSLKLTDTNLFSDPADRVEQAYDLQAARIAYVRK